MRALIELHDQRGSLYGTDYLSVGVSLAGIFPGGVELHTASDFARFALFIHAHGKLVRYATQFSEHGHGDSLDDLSVYSQLLRHTDDVS